MRLIVIAGAAVFALAIPALAQEQSAPANAVGNGAAKALEPGPGHMDGTPVSPSKEGASQRRKATTMRPAGTAPENGMDKPAGTTGAPPYGSSTPRPPSSGGADDTPRGG
jgi:hypothetical protein